MNLEPNESLHVILFGNDTVGIQTQGGTSLFTPEVAVQIAQSLINVAKEADPDLDVEAAMKAWPHHNGPTTETIN